MKKGRFTQAIIPGNREGGWGRNPAYTNYSVATANALTPDFLREHSFFFPFDESGLYGANGSFHAQQLRSQLLADAIPALSNPAGRNALTNNVVCGNENMAGFRPGTYQQGLWPDKNNRWCHSDIKTMPYLFVWEVFETIVENGRLR